MEGRKYDLYSYEFREKTHETYATMREQDPVFKQPGLDGTTPIWFVTRHEDAMAVLLDDERFVLDPALALTPEEFEARAETLQLQADPRVNTHLLTKDGDDHRRLRRLVSKAFTPRMVEGLRPRVQEIADGLIDTVEPRGEMDLVDDFAFPLPIVVICELLGIPSEDRNRFREWSNLFLTPAMTEEEQQTFAVATEQFLAYLHELFERRRAEAGDDLVSALVRAEEAGETLSEDELFSMVVLLIVAGHETTVSLISNSVLALLTHPEELERLRADPAALPEAVEELLRFDSPVERSITRWATTDVEVGSQTIRRGDLVIAVIGSANRDPDRFPDAEKLDLGRGDTKHLGFGRGPHFCLGAPLARLEAEIALRTLFDRLPSLQLAIEVKDLYWRPIPLFRSLASLPVAWDAR
jgi:cytochrome P450